MNEDMCTRTLWCAYMYMLCCLMTESSTSLDEATLYDGLKLYKTKPEKINANTLIIAKIPHLTRAIQVDFLCHAGVLKFILVP